MKRIKQCASAVTAVLTSAAMLWGCAVASESDSRQELIKGLEKKYGESFTLIEDAGGGNFSADHCAVYVRSESFPNERIYAVHGVFDGKTEDRDNFMAYWFRNEAVTYLTDMAEDIYGDCRSFYVPDDRGVLPADIGKDSSVGDMLRGGKFYWYLLLPEGQDLSKKDEQLDELMDKLAEEKTGCYFYIAYMDDNGVYRDTSSPKELDRDHILADCTVGMDDNFNITERKWEVNANG
ncbi:hypothetical protein [Ruminococcus flavefaciens]|uniref:hypothetical protein n=1 Tax=Ruminococcus flavefaciens TaxID=1265 RepID=UPI00048E740B|nr:hypothetical protein [Ruminococcus flavefaciens]